MLVLCYHKTRTHLSLDKNCPQSLSALAEKLIAEKVKHKRWDKKTASRVRPTFQLFGKSLEHDDLSRISQKDLSDFKDLLNAVAKSYGKSISDKNPTAKELRAKGAALPGRQRACLTHACRGAER